MGEEGKVKKNRRSIRTERCKKKLTNKALEEEIEKENSRSTGRKDEKRRSNGRIRRK